MATYVLQIVRSEDHGYASCYLCSNITDLITSNKIFLKRLFKKLILNLKLILNAFE